MCGIAGILGFGATPERARLRTMTDTLAHRGPDGSGEWLQGPVALGHRRLSIIDLSAAASQPMLSDDGQFAIVFNGEIYNYRELAGRLAAAGRPCRTHSDTEVILNLYRQHGAACLQYLRGMFAFAIWDVARQELFLARDRVGIKPLYCLHSPSAFVFASEIKAIAAAGFSALRVDAGALAGFFRFMVVPQPHSIFTDVHKLEPGHWLRVRADGTCDSQSWWSVPAGETQPALDEAVWASALDEQLRESVGYHMVADVPVGAFLSGGLDSGGVVALMRELHPRQDLQAYSIGFPGEEGYDETAHAREVAALKNVGFNTRVVDARFIDDLPAMAWSLDEPFAITSAYAGWYLARHAAAGTKVVLTGDGGDELFAGYAGYRNDRYRHRGVPLAGAACGLLLHGARLGLVRGASADRLLIALRARSGSEGLRYSAQVAQNSFNAMAMVLRRDVFLDALSRWAGNRMAAFYDTAPGSEALERKLYAEYRTRLVDEMLMKVDRMTMAHSLEARVPLLDHRVVEFAFRVPAALKIGPAPDGSIVGKRLLRRVLERYLPAQVIYRPKQGFNVPVRSWLEGGLREAVGERLLSGRLREARLIDETGIRRLMARATDTAHNYGSMLINLLALESWADVYGSRVGRISWR